MCPIQFQTHDFLWLSLWPVLKWSWKAMAIKCPPIRFEAFTVTECNEVLSGYQLCENGVVIQRFGDCLCLHHLGWYDEWHDCTHIYTHGRLSELHVFVCRQANRNSVRVRQSVIPVLTQSTLLNIDGLEQSAIPVISTCIIRVDVMSGITALTFLYPWLALKDLCPWPKVGQ
jgi:hypothetical protein